MKKVMVVVVVLLLAGLALGYWQGWFSVSNQGVQVDAEKFKQDKTAFSKTVGEKTKALRDQVAGLWKKSKDLTGDEKAEAEKELDALEKKHGRIEKQLQELEQAGQDRFGSLKQDLSKTLDEVEQQIVALTERLEKGKEK